MKHPTQPNLLLPPFLPRAGLWFLLDLTPSPPSVMNLASQVFSLQSLGGFSWGWKLHPAGIDLWVSVLPNEQPESATKAALGRGQAASSPTSSSTASSQAASFTGNNFPTFFLPPFSPFSFPQEGCFWSNRFPSSPLKHPHPSALPSPGAQQHLRGGFSSPGCFG